jgi:hypothetical protein
LNNKKTTITEKKINNYLKSWRFSDFGRANEYNNQAMMLKNAKKTIFVII